MDVSTIKYHWNRCIADIHYVLALKLAHIILIAPLQPLCCLVFSMNVVQTLYGPYMAGFVVMPVNFICCPGRFLFGKFNGRQWRRPGYPKGFEVIDARAPLRHLGSPVLCHCPYICGVSLSLSFLS